MNSNNSDRSTWYAVSGGSDLPIGSARAVMLNDEDIVIWRSNAGVVHAWQNRCLHRGMRLSFGQVRGNQLTCRYHGWMFDSAGQCTYMPAQPDLKPAVSLCVKRYGCAERKGLIWMNIQSTESESLDAALQCDNDNPSWLFCKSLFVDIKESELQTHLKRINFPIYSAADNAGKFKVIDKPVTMAAAKSSPRHEQMYMTLHPLSDSRTALHICISKTSASSQETSKLLYYQSWARRLRWFLNNPDQDYDGLHPFIRSEDTSVT